MVCKNALFYSYFFIQYWIFVTIASSGDSTIYPKHMFLGEFNETFLHNFRLTLNSRANVLCQSNYHYNEFCRCIECRKKEHWRYNHKWMFTRLKIVSDILCSYAVISEEKQYHLLATFLFSIIFYVMLTDISRIVIMDHLLRLSLYLKHM